MPMVRGALLTRPLAGESASTLRPAAARCMRRPSGMSGLDTVSTSGEGVSGTVACGYNFSKVGKMAFVHPA